MDEGRAPNRSVPHSAGVRRGGLPAQAPSHASDSYARWGEPGKEPRRSERRRRVSLHYRTRLCDKQSQQFRLQTLQNADLTQTERGSCVGSERSRLCSTRAQPSSFISSKAKAGAENSRRHKPSCSGSHPSPQAERSSTFLSKMNLYKRRERKRKVRRRAKGSHRGLAPSLHLNSYQ